MFAGTLGRGGHPDQFVDTQLAAGSGADKSQNRLATGQGAGLVEDEGVDLGETFKGSGTLDDDTLSSQPGHSRHDRAGSRQDQRAGAGDDQDSECRQVSRFPGSGLAKESPAQQCQQRGQQYRGQKQTCQSIGGPFDRSLPLGCLGHQRNHLSQLRLVTDLASRDHQGAKLVECSGENGIAGFLVNRQAFTGQRRLVDGGGARVNQPIDGESFAGPDDHQVVGLEFVDGHVVFLTVDQAMGEAGAQLEDATDGSLCPVDCVPLDAFTAQGHEHHQGGGDRFTQQDGGQAGDCQGEVGTDASGEQPFQRLKQDP